MAKQLFDYALRRVTSSGRDLPVNCAQNIKEFHDKCRQIRIEVPRSALYSMDQTSVYLDSPSDYITNTNKY